MPRLLFEKKGTAIWISHLDLMRMFQRAFKRAGFSLTHTHGFNPRPSVSIALPLSVGVDSTCELLDFDLEGESVPHDVIKDQLNKGLVNGVRVINVYDNGRKIKDLAYLNSIVQLEYDGEVPKLAAQQIEALFKQDTLVVTKKTKNGMKDQDIIPMIRNFRIEQTDACTLCFNLLACCQNPTLSPAQISQAISTYLPEYAPAHVRYSRVEVYDQEEKVFR